MNISVKIHFPSGEICRGVLTYTAEGPQLVSQESSDVLNYNDNIQVSVSEEYSDAEIKLKSGIRFEYDSK